MGCTDEKSVSNRHLKNNNRNTNNLNYNCNNKNDKEINNLEGKKNHSKEEDIKEITKQMKTKQDLNTIRYECDDEFELNQNIINNMEKSKEKEEKINNNDNDNENANNEENEENEDEEEKEEDKEEEEEEEEENLDDVDDDNREMIRQLGPYLQEKVNPNFNFPEVKNSTYVGKGLRRMKAYISIVPKDELEKRRIAFWGTRVEGDPQVWSFLKELCNLPEGEEENIKAMLEANEITPLKKCINVTYDKAGEVYEIPNYCINEPFSFDLPEMHVKKPEKKNISFHVRRGADQIKIKAYNTTLVEKVKSNIAKKLEINENKIRLFFRGKEMKNEKELWVYNIEDDCVVIIMCTG